ncbi:hypothetical protein [Natrinema salaciae]|uniref:hypothetical protein n=1 Tax=Natrinema salaciae TaxID=1186196 RepID=UPI000B83FD63|nr:hypothetical protein [Natrinema salaciae]
MTSPFDTRDLLQESTPVAIILLFWVVLSSIVTHSIANGLLRAGVIMALLYTIVRGVTLARTHQPTPQPDGLEGVLRENVKVALPAGVWFLAAHIVYSIETLWNSLGIPVSVTFLAETLSFIFIGAGVAVVLLYAIAVGLPRVRGNTPNKGNDMTGATPAND